MGSGKKTLSFSGGGGISMTAAGQLYQASKCSPKALGMGEAVSQQL